MQSPDRHQQVAPFQQPQRGLNGADGGRSGAKAILSLATVLEPALLKRIGHRSDQSRRGDERLKRVDDLLLVSTQRQEQSPVRLAKSFCKQNSINYMQRQPASKFR